MLRGWKRAGEIEEKHARFCFLMKLSELSFCVSKFRQALAVLNDIPEPDSQSQNKPYWILMCHVRSANNDVQGTLRAFQRAIEGADYQDALRVLALVIIDLKSLDIYELGKTAVEKLAAQDQATYDLNLLDRFAYKEPDEGFTADDAWQKYFVASVVVAVVAVLVYILHVLEK